MARVVPRVVSLIAVLGAALLLASCAPTGGPTPSARPRHVGAVAQPTPNGMFHIVGRDIVAPDGRIFVPMGANVAVRQGRYETGYTFNWNGTATDRSADVAAWGWNTVRANVICNSPGTPTQAEIDAGIDAFIDEYTAKKIVVIVDCHDVTGANPTSGSIKVQGIYRFMDRLAAKYRNNPYVWFNVLNEPISGSSAADLDAWLALHRDALARLRSIAPHSIFVADLPGYGQAMDSFFGDRSVARLGAGQCNVLYSWHAYGALGNGSRFGSYNDWADPTRSRANHQAALDWIASGSLPVMIGEFGDPLTLNEGTAGQPIWNRNAARAVMEFAPAADVGLLWWHATGDSGVFLTYSLTADRGAPWAAAHTGAGLSASGRTFWEISRNPIDRGAFVGDLAASNC